MTTLEMDLKAARANVAAGIMTYPETVRTILEAYDALCDELAEYAETEDPVRDGWVGKDGRP